MVVAPLARKFETVEYPVLARDYEQLPCLVVANMFYFGGALAIESDETFALALQTPDFKEAVVGSLQIAIEVLEPSERSQVRIVCTLSGLLNLNTLDDR
jgi:hypothetical protein